MYKRFLGLGLVAIMLLCGCGGRRFTSVIPPQGMIYSHVKAPLTTEYEETPVSRLEGRANTKRVYIPLPFAPIEVAWGDAGMHTAAMDGDIARTSAADYEFLNILGVFQQLTVIPYGESEP